MSRLEHLKNELGWQELSTELRAKWEQLFTTFSDAALEQFLVELCDLDVLFIEYFVASKMLSGNKIDQATQFVHFLQVYYPGILKEASKARPLPLSVDILKHAATLFESQFTFAEPRLSSFLHGDSLAPFDTFTLVGSPDFIARSVEVLCLLRERMPTEYSIAKKYLGVLREWFQSGVSVEALPPTFFVSRKVAFASRAWYASAIAHEAWHSKLFFEHRATSQQYHVPGEIYSGAGIEKECNKFQLSVLRGVGGNEFEIAHLESCKGDHQYQDWGVLDANTY